MAVAENDNCGHAFKRDAGFESIDITVYLRDDRVCFNGVSQVAATHLLNDRNRCIYAARLDGRPAKDIGIEYGISGSHVHNLTEQIKRRLEEMPGHAKAFVLFKAHFNSRNNRQYLQRGGQCACFHCLQEYDASEVKNWGGQDETTALCPYCFHDTVLSVHIARIDDPFVSKMYKTYFGAPTRTLRLEAMV